MDSLIWQLQSQDSNTLKALFVAAGGLVGVFATLGLFFLLIWVSGKVSRKA